MGELTALPRWLLVGLGLGAVCSLLAAALLFLADRRDASRANRYDRGGETRRRGELREYLDAIGERYAEGHVVEGQTVAFYLPERDVAVTFDPRAYYRLDRSDTYAVLFEHEMPASHLGDRLPFEVPTVESGDPASERPDPAAAAFAELGVPAGADVEAVRAAYRRRVKETHPDQGGDEAAFRRVREAYATARRHAE